MKNNPCGFSSSLYKYFSINVFAIKAIIILICCLVLIKTNAQKVGYDIAYHYTNDNGLPQNSINAMQQDHNGFIWLSTFGGLVRYDGHTLRTYNPSNTPGIHTSSFYAFSLKNGVLQIAPSYYDGTLLLLDDSKTLITRQIEPSSFYGLTFDGQVTDFGRSYPDYLKKMDWYSLQSQRQKQESGEWCTVIAEPNKSDGYVHDNYDKVWYYNGDKGSLCYTGNGSPFDEFLIGNDLYIYNKQAGLLGWHIGHALGKINGNLSSLLKQAATIKKETAKFYFKQGNSFLKLGEKLYLVNEKNGSLDAELLSSHITITDISAILYLPKENLLLIGTPTLGLYVLKNRPLTSLLYRYESSDPNSVEAKNSLYAIAAINDSTLLTTTGTIDLKRKNILNKSVMDWSRYVLLWLDKNHIIITGSHGIYQTNENFDHPTLVSSLPNGAMATYLRYMDTLYVAIDSILIKTTVVGTSIKKVGENIFSENISSLAKKGDGALYVGTRKGLYLLQNNGRADTVSGLGKIYVNALYQSNHSDLWVATLGEGWYRCNQQGVTKMPVDSKGYLLRIHSFTEDGNGFMWMPTNNGMFRFLYADLQQAGYKNPDARLFYNFFDKSYGSATSEYNGSCTPAVAKVKNGGLVFPSIQGLVLLYPDKIPVEQPNKSLLVEDIYADTTAVNINKLRLEPDFNTLTMHVTTPFYGEHYNLQLEYRLSGASTGWTKVDENGNIRFNRLPSGDYHLYIRKLSGYGQNKSQLVAFDFTVAPHWYRSYWFTFLWLFAIVVLTVLYVRYQGRLAKKQNAILENKVSLRTLELSSAMQKLEDSIDQLKTSEAKLKQTSEFREQITSLVLHDIRSPLMFLDNITENIYSSANGIVPAAFKEKLYNLHVGVKEIGGYAQRLLVWVNLQQDGFIMKRQPVNIQLFLTENVMHYQPLAQQKGILLYSIADEQIVFYTQRNLLEIVVRNLLDNAIKNTEQGQIDLSANLQEGNLKITVKDTGKGMSNDTVKRLLEDDGKTAASDTGLGYRFIHDVLKKMQGQLEIVSEPEMGSTISIIFLAVSNER